MFLCGDSNGMYTNTVNLSLKTGVWREGNARGMLSWLTTQEQTHTHRLTGYATLPLLWFCICSTFTWGAPRPSHCHPLLVKYQQFARYPLGSGRDAQGFKELRHYQVTGTDNITQLI